MAVAKRVLLFVVLNFVVVITLSVIVSLLGLDRVLPVVEGGRPAEDDRGEDDPLAAEAREPDLVPHGGTPMAGRFLLTNSPTVNMSSGTGFPSATSRLYFWRRMAWSFRYSTVSATSLSLFLRP